MIYLGRIAIEQSDGDEAVGWLEQAIKKNDRSSQHDFSHLGGMNMGSMTEASPRFIARMGGLFYLLMVVSGGFGSVARKGIIVAGDAAATATNIMAHPSQYQLGFAGDVLLVATYVVVVAYFHRMLRPVNRSVALVAAYFGLMGCAVLASALVFQLAPLAVLGHATYLNVFKVDELQAQAYLFLRLYNQAYGISLVFFGFFMLVTGYLIFRSTFLPRVLGVMFSIGGLAALTFLAPAWGASHLSWVLLFDIGEALLPLWLLLKGVNAERWKEQNCATADRLNAA